MSIEHFVSYLMQNSLMNVKNTRTLPVNSPGKKSFQLHHIMTKLEK